MARLSDMEELIGQVEDLAMQQYMREAMRCYMTDAYRACIILSFIAIYENIYQQLDRLAIVNRTAKEIHDNIKAKKDGQEVFEKDMIDQLSGANIVSKLDASFLNILRDLRNKSAHPSGHNPSAEEARYVFSECITRFLIKPILSTNQKSDEILDSLSGGNLFPTLKAPDYKLIVEHELSNFSSEGIPYLLNKLISKLDDEDKIVRTNASRFILGICYEQRNEFILDKLRKILIIKQISKSEREIEIIQAIVCAPDLLANLNAPTYLRLNEVFIKACNKSDINVPFTKILHPLRILSAISSLEKILAIQLFKNSINTILNKFKYNTDLSSIVVKSEWLRDLYFIILLDNAQSYTFSEANSFVRTAILLDEILSNTLNEIQCLSLLAGIYKSHTYDAIESTKAVQSKFKSLPYLKQKAQHGYPANEEKYKEMILAITNNQTLTYEELLG